MDESAGRARLEGYNPALNSIPGREYFMAVKKRTPKAGKARKPAAKAGKATKAAKAPKTVKRPVAKAPAKKTAKAKAKAKTRPVPKSASPKVRAKSAPAARKSAGKPAAKPAKAAPVKAKAAATAKPVKAAAVNNKAAPKAASVPEKTVAEKKVVATPKAAAPRTGPAPIRAVAMPATQRRVVHAADDEESAEGEDRHNLLLGPRNVKPYVQRKGEEYMGKLQLEHFRTILASWKQDLMEEVDRTMTHMKDEAANPPDPNDRATLESEFALELRTRDRERKLIRKIDEALQRIEDGSYGYCLETGEPIGVKRLEARPVATLCIEAQERRERREKQYGDRDDWYR
jgi:DnaK suppressor protein